MERLGVPVLIKVTTEGGFVFVLNTNMQVAPEMHADDPEVKKYLQEEGLQIGRSPLLIRVASNPGSGIQFQPDTRAVVITRNATGIDIHRYFMRGGVPYVSLMPVETKMIVENGVQKKILDAKYNAITESPVAITK
jgi:hypothetical protein